jgi:hypothetical protein
MSYCGYIYDNYAQNNTSYTYSLIPIISEEEGTPETSTVLSIFCDDFICDYNSSYKITADISYNGFERVKMGGIKQPPSRKYPIVHQFGSTNYTMGSIDFHLNSIDSADIISIDEITYRKEFLAFLATRSGKIFKDLNGNIWLIALYNSFPQKFLKEMGNQVCNISFDFCQIGEANTESDLLKAGMLNKFILYTE